MFVVDYFYRKTNKLLNYLLKPKSKDRDSARREFILNIVLIAIIFLSFVAFLVAWGTKLYRLAIGQVYDGASPKLIFAFFAIFLAGYLFSRAGKFKMIGQLLIGAIFFGSTYTSYKWGVGTPQGLLSYSLIIVMAGILINSRVAFFLTSLIFLVLLLLTQLQFENILSFDRSWRNRVPDVGDAVTYGVTLSIISIISWLSNREIEKSLKRAWRSEAALKRQRDRLEILVEKRTKELKLAQAEKLAQLYRFAQFGRMASGLFHDLANPLNLVSLNLDLLSRKSKKVGQQKLSDAKVFLNRAVDGARRLESFVQAARRQVQHQEVLQTFSLKEEIDQAFQMLQRRAARSHVKLLFKSGNNIKTFGNPVKFSQLITNLVSNAIDVYETTKRNLKFVEVKLQKIDSSVRLEVQDWGSGIKEKDLPKIFDPLFTTKSIEKGTGMGLSICKDVVEKDFKGKCTVKSQRGVGTTFIVEFPIKKAPKSRS